MTGTSRWRRGSRRRCRSRWSRPGIPSRSATASGWPSRRPTGRGSGRTPDEATLTIDPRHSAVTLPVWTRRDDDGVRFEEPTRATPLAVRALPAASDLPQRSVSHDVGTGEWVLDVDPGYGGGREYPDGLVFTEDSRETYRITDGDPLSASRGVALGDRAREAGVEGVARDDVAADGDAGRRSSSSTPAGLGARRRAGGAGRARRRTAVRGPRAEDVGVSGCGVGAGAGAGAGAAGAAGAAVAGSRQKPAVRRALIVEAAREVILREGLGGTGCATSRPRRASRWAP